MTRTFIAAPAERAQSQLSIGIMGSSGSGKTYSALRLATGMQRVTGGDVYVLDADAKRSLHYAERFKFMHVPFTAPYSPADFHEAITYCIKRGAKTIVIDGASMMHEGAGGLLEMQEAELKRMGGNMKLSLPAWKMPKRELLKLRMAITEMPANFIFCFRAKDKIKPNGNTMEELGFMPIMDKEFMYELTLNALLMPGADGVPTWKSQEAGEKLMIKLPEQFRTMLMDGQTSLSEDVGEMLARWAAGTGAPPKAAGPVLFAKQFAEYGGSPIVDAPPSVVAHYIESLLATLNDDAKRALHSQVRSHLDKVRAAVESKAEPA